MSECIAHIILYYITLHLLKNVLFYYALVYFTPSYYILCCTSWSYTAFCLFCTIFYILHNLLHSTLSCTVVGILRCYIVIYVIICHDMLCCVALRYVVNVTMYHTVTYCELWHVLLYHTVPNLPTVHYIPFPFWLTLQFGATLYCDMF